jgi:predicted nucleic acid-binding protein
MRIVLDASVAIAAQRSSEPFYEAARARLVRFLTGADIVVVPSLFIVEVSGALARLGFERRKIARLVDALTIAPHEVVAVGPRTARAARTVAVKAKLRGPDALYVWLAGREGLPLCTIDREIVTRGAPFCSILAP